MDHKQEQPESLTVVLNSLKSIQDQYGKVNEMISSKIAMESEIDSKVPGDARLYPIEKQLQDIEPIARHTLEQLELLNSELRGVSADASTMVSEVAKRVKDTIHSALEEEEPMHRLFMLRSALLRNPREIKAGESENTLDELIKLLEAN